MINNINGKSVKSNKNKVSPYVIRRLPRYYRFLGGLIDEGTLRISSRGLAQRMGLTASQIRQDLNCFGGFGQQGYGYNVEGLRNEIADILGMDKVNRVIIIGAGNIGQAICDDISFEKRGCVLTGIFDRDSKLHGRKINQREGVSHEIQSMGRLAEFCRMNKPNIAVLCIPMEGVENVCEELIKLNVKSFWNFSHFDVSLHYKDRDDINVVNVHLGDSLLTLVYNLNRKL
jgi:redox-sensing transcriptional repressor